METVEYDPAALAPFHAKATLDSDHVDEGGVGRGESSKRSLVGCVGFPVTSNSNDASNPAVNVAGITTYLFSHLQFKKERLQYIN